MMMINRQLCIEIHPHSRKIHGPLECEGFQVLHLCRSCVIRSCETDSWYPAYGELVVVVGTMYLVLFLGILRLTEAQFGEILPSLILSLNPWYHLQARKQLGTRV